MRKKVIYGSLLVMAFSMMPSIAMAEVYVENHKGVQL